MNFATGLSVVTVLPKRIAHAEFAIVTPPRQFVSRCYVFLTTGIRLARTLLARRLFAGPGTWFLGGVVLVKLHIDLFFVFAWEHPPPSGCGK